MRKTSREPRNGRRVALTGLLGIFSEIDVENDFLDLYEYQSMLALEIGHNGIVDWNIFIYERRGKEPGNWGDAVIHVSSTSRKETFARAYVALKDYVDETRS